MNVKQKIFKAYKNYHQYSILYVLANNCTIFSSIFLIIELNAWNGFLVK